jgi:probable HAF family extracellular repeat protein
MKRIVICLMAPALLLCGAARVSAEYIITDLGTLGGKQSAAQAINAAGQVVGYAYISPEGAHAFLYGNGQMTNLGAMPNLKAYGASPYSPSYATGVNASGQVVFYVAMLGVPLPPAPPGAAPNRNHSFLYSGGKVTDLGSLGGYGTSAAGINDAGQIVGGSSTKSGDQHAFLYDGGKMTDLGTLPGGRNSIATANNMAGQVVGQSETADGSGRAFLYSNGKMADLGTLGGSTSEARTINSSGQVVGTSQTGSGISHAFLYSDGKMTDLGALGGTLRYSEATAINNAGQVVGWSQTADGQTHAFLFIDGKLTDLNCQLPANSGWILNGANGINNKGQIVGYGSNAAGQTHAFLLTPVAEAPEPTSLVLLSLGGLGLAGHAWRQRRRAAA